jgi:hypothetical protein
MQLLKCDVDQTLAVRVNTVGYAQQRNEKEIQEKSAAKGENPPATRLMKSDTLWELGMPSRSSYKTLAAS